MALSVRALVLSLCNLIALALVAFFASGFFPYKPFLPGHGRVDVSNGEPPRSAPFDKVIFMVVDALRSDFVFSERSGFGFAQSLISEGHALPFTAHAAAPTVTMPRLKAITTGSIPSFLDMILNFAESDTTSDLSTQDTWLSQMVAKERGGSIMYGDDTWLKLFPNTFIRADGTSSFFVSDFTEVDNNVTRHIPGELANDDWNVMIMHYLGMDHIGHKAGPRSVNMMPKQQEMDGILRSIYEAILSKEHLNSTLLVMCGDHGMNEGGNHGGSAPGETSTALVFVSPKFRSVSKGRACPTEAQQDYSYYRTIEQSDIAPTLAGLLGFPVPINSLGVFISDFLSMWDPEMQAQLLYENAYQMMGIARATFPHPVYENATFSINCGGPLGPADNLACDWKNAVTAMASWSSTEQPMQQLRAEILPLMYKFCYTAQRLLSSAASNYDTQRLYEGLSLTAVVALVALFLSWSSLDLGTSFTGWMILATVCLDSAMMFASSYVEEEHQFWLWMTAAWLSVSILRSSPNLGAILTASRPLLLVPALRAWNTSGQKQSGEASIVSAFLPAYPLVLWALVTLTLIDLLSQLRSKTLQRSGVPAAISYGIATLAAGQIFCFKVVFTLHDSPELFGPALLPLSEQFASCFSDLTAMARVAFLLPTSLLLYVILTRFKGDRKSTMPLSSLGPPILAILLIQTRLTNIPLFLVFSLLKRALPSSIPQTVPSITLTTILLSHASFYALGNTNSISSIDLSNAYNGVSSFNVVAVGFLLLLSTFAGPFYWSLAGLEMLGDLEKPGQVQGTATLEGNGALAVRYLEYLKLKTLFMTGSAVAVMAACTLLREHLFVWTVFSPKFLFLVAWFVGWHVLWGGVVEGMIVWSGGV